MPHDTFVRWCSVEVTYPCPHEGLLSERFGKLIVDRLKLRLMVFDDEQEKVLQWIE